MGASTPPMSEMTRAALARIARRIAEGFCGEIQLQVRDGVRSIRWIQLEEGNTIKEELQ